MPLPCPVKRCRQGPQTMRSIGIVHILRILCTLDILLIFSILMRKPSKMTITLLAKKGGVGKSSVCLLLHEAFKKVGKSVAIQHWDAQGTSNKALGFIDGQRAQ